MHLVHRLVVLGAQGVGKTTLIENFLSNCVLPLQPTHTAKQTTTSDMKSEECLSYSCSVLLDDIILQVKIIDVPPVTFFPSIASSSILDWTDLEGTAIRSADAFILVFDLSSPASFQYLKTMRDQLIEGRGKDMQKSVPVFVIGNKADCIVSAISSVRHHLLLPHHHRHHSSQESRHHHHHHEPPPALKELAALVRKQWKSSYWEVSALHLWRVHSLFMRILETVTQQRKEHHDQRKDHHHHKGDHFQEDHHYHHQSHVTQTSDTTTQSARVKRRQPIIYSQATQDDEAGTSSCRIS